MSLFFIAVLSVVQGLTEFLPISSSGHLVLLPHLLGEHDQGLAMDVALHIGTLMAALVYYRKDVWNMAAAVLTWKATKDKTSRNLGVYIVLATIPAVIFGLVIETVFPGGIRSVNVVIANTLIFAVIMAIADRFGKKTETIKGITLKQALIIGCAQCLALIPGTSRSGITITAALFLGINRVDAAKFSFLLGMPAIAGAGLIGLLDLIKAGDTAALQDAAIGASLSFLTGLAAIHFMIKWLGRHSLMPFVVYRLILGAGLIAFLVV